MKIELGGEFTNEAAVVDCSVDSNDALRTEYDPEAGFMFELLGSKDPVHIGTDEAIELARWILKKANVPVCFT